MPGAATEHRGWETNVEVSPHWMDDPDYDITAERHEGSFWVTLILLTGLVVGTYVGGKALEAPAVNFPAPVPIPLVSDSIPNMSRYGYDVPFIPSGWGMSCIAIDGKRKTMHPNYLNPNCTIAAARRRGDIQ